MDTPEGLVSGAATLCELDAHRLKIIRAALEGGRVEFGRQAIVPLQRTNEGAYYELIARVRDDRGAVLPKDVFVAAVERLGMTDRVDWWLFESALGWLQAEDKGRGGPALCFFRPFSRSLSDANFAHFVTRSLRESGVNPSRLCLEIRETDVITRFAQAEHCIPLHELGCRIAVDDVGRGHGSLNYFHYFPATFVRIDGRLVERILHDPNYEGLVRGINQIGHTFRMTTIAKGVDSPELVDVLREMKVDYAEGSAV